MTWEWTFAKPFLVAHAVVGFASVAVAVHLALIALAAQKRSSPRRRRLAAIYSRWLLVFCIATVFTGALAYPAFRVGIRAAWMDAQRPELTALFEIKEHWGSLCLALAAALAFFFRRRAQNPTPGEDPSWRWATLLCQAGAAGLIYSLLAGLYLVLEGSP